MAITIEKGKLLIDHADIVNPVKDYFPFAKFRNGKWEMMATYQAVETVNKLYGLTLSVDVPEAEVDVTKFLERIKVNFRVKPYKHQLEALATCNMRHFYAYFLEPGLGKTKITIDDAHILYCLDLVDTVLIVCPLSAVPVWERELKKNLDNPVFSSWPEKPPMSAGLRWYIINHDALVTNAVSKLKNEKKLNVSIKEEEIRACFNKKYELENDTTSGFYYASRFLYTSSRSMMVIDESTSICNWKSLRTQFCTKLGFSAEYRRILTGDPIPNKPIDLYSQLYWLDPTTVGNRSFYAFRGHYCDMGGYKNKAIIGYKNLDELTAIYRKHGYRARTKDVLDMPPQNWNVRKLTPGEKLRLLYDEIVENDIIPIIDEMGDDAYIYVNTMLKQFTKLQQVCGGTLLDDDGVPHVVNTQKADEFIEMMDEWKMAGVLVWCQYRAECDLLAKKLKDAGKEVLIYSGDLKKNERGQMTDLFEDGYGDFLIIQNDAGYASITLNRAPYSVFYSNHLRPLVRNQSERRNWRIGQEKPVFYYDLLFDGLIDEWWYEQLQKKRDFNMRITDYKATKKELLNIVRGGDK